MGRKRKNVLKAGSQTTLYIPQDINPEVLAFLNDQANVSKALLEIAQEHVLHRNKITNLEHLETQSVTLEDIQNIVNELVEKKLKQVEKTEEKKQTSKTEAIRNLTFKL